MGNASVWWAGWSPADVQLELLSVSALTYVTGPGDGEDRRRSIILIVYIPNFKVNQIRP